MLNHGRLSNKVALITGVASDPSLGRAIAYRFAEEGARLVVSDIDARGLEDCVRQLQGMGAEVTSLLQDVTLEGDWQKAIEHTETAFGQLDILINNAGIAVLRPLQDLSLADFEKQMTVNMTSVYLGCRFGLQAMKKGGGGSIVNMSSIAGIVGIPGVSAYAASKGGVRAFTKNVAMEGAPDNVRCNSIHPGTIATNIMLDSQRDNPEQHELLINAIPLKRLGRPVEVANCALFLASEESAYITGAELVIDGGVIAK
ncbi:glucose 1-dehydrogenase [Aestuariicella hydrocarbonica]|uniref:Glucose 1-dehydrogenase n=1 Tax=Pseudomaricurvus hydrocarbonicus TaxID=1470433 RepID=A0A9E5JXM4_9GAMM|nr:glucose 1-dehydrogenase [Aestuariicella hydrocarbonica]NHO66835.1 glucose 1-dehydrogenase [Aestuariicella hydrocarbonica]